jgi:hypothetical protein
MRLTDNPMLLQSPSYPQLDPFYECFSFSYQSWMKIPATYIHTLARDHALLIRRVGVIGSDEDLQIARACAINNPPSPTIPIPSIPLRKRDRKGKSKQAAITVDDDDDDDIVIVGFKPAIKQKPPSPPRPVKRLRYTLSPLSSSPDPPAFLLPFATSSSSSNL